MIGCGIECSAALLAFNASPPWEGLPPIDPNEATSHSRIMWQVTRHGAAMSACERRSLPQPTSGEIGRHLERTALDHVLLPLAAEVEHAQTLMADRQIAERPQEFADFRVPLRDCIMLL